MQWSGASRTSSGASSSFVRKEEELLNEGARLGQNSVAHSLESVQLTSLADDPGLESYSHAFRIKDGVLEAFTYGLMEVIFPKFDDQELLDAKSQEAKFNQISHSRKLIILLKRWLCDEQFMEGQQYTKSLVIKSLRELQSIYGRRASAPNHAGAPRMPFLPPRPVNLEPINRSKGSRGSQFPLQIGCNKAAIFECPESPNNRTSHPIAHDLTCSHALSAFSQVWYAIIQKYEPKTQLDSLIELARLFDIGIRLYEQSKRGQKAIKYQLYRNKNNILKNVNLLLIKDIQAYYLLLEKTSKQQMNQTQISRIDTIVDEEIAEQPDLIGLLRRVNSHPIEMVMSRDRLKTLATADNDKQFEFTVNESLQLAQQASQRGRRIIDMLMNQLLS